MNTDDTHKKAHYHVLFMFDGVKSYNQVKSIADSVNAPIPQIVGSAKGLTRYMLHLDNPDKAQYDSSDLQAFNGTDIRSEEHTSELQSRGHIVCRILLEKKKKNKMNDKLNLQRID